jgi:hypothetical protein
MSTLNVTTVSATNIRASSIQDTGGNNGSTPAAIANGIAKAWVNFNGTGTVSIRASFNVSSITDNGTGLYTINFTTALADANYSAVFGGGVTGTASWARTGNPGFTYTTTGLQLACNSSAAALDHSIVSVAIFR